MGRAEEAGKLDEVVAVTIAESLLVVKQIYWRGKDRAGVKAGELLIWVDAECVDMGSVARLQSQPRSVKRYGRETRAVCEGRLWILAGLLLWPKTVGISITNSWRRVWYAPT